MYLESAVTWEENVTDTYSVILTKHALGYLVEKSFGRKVLVLTSSLTIFMMFIIHDHCLLENSFTLNPKFLHCKIEF